MNWKTKALMQKTISCFPSLFSSRICFLKKDIEGAEKEVFCENSGNWFKKVKLIIIEPQEENQPSRPDAFLDATGKVGFELLLAKGDNLVYINKSLT